MYMNDQNLKFSLLFIDNDQNILSSIKRVLIEDGYIIYTASNGQEALLLLRRKNVDAALIDSKMPGMDGLALLKEIKKSYPGIMAIILTSHGGIKEAVEACKLGATDYLEKPFANDELRIHVRHLYKLWVLNRENRALKDKIEFSFGYERLMGNSQAMLKLKAMIAQIGPTDASVLIQGETGTGKELTARAIHAHSLRTDNPFIPVDCAAISDSIMESELFGHIKGAFTGAHVSSPGLIRSAHTGTVFFDEIGELSPAVQAKILRTIQEREVKPVGSSKRYLVDVRILAATNRDLEKEVGLGNFREDLFYRLNVVTLYIPPLRERQEDIPLLAGYFTKHLGTDVTPAKAISREAIQCLESYDWPGNVRELENVIMRAIVLGKENDIIPADLPPHINTSSQTTSKSAARASDGPSDDSLDSYERAAILNALNKSDSNRKKAAHILGIGEATLYRKIKKYKINV